MSRRLPWYLGLALLVAFLLQGQRNIGPAAARDRAWAWLGAEPHQQGTPTPSPSPEPPPVVCPTCPPLPSPHDAMMASESVFQCTVTEVVNLGPEGDWDYRVTCPMERYWTRGGPSSFYVPWSVWECGLVFHPGENWLIYANRDDRIDHCSRTAPFSDEEALELGEWCEPAWIDVRPDRTAVRVGERFDVAFEYVHAMPMPESVSVGPSGLVDVVSDGWGRSPVGGAGSWRCEHPGRGNTCGHLTMVARRPGVLQIDAGAYTEVDECDKGTRTYVFGGVSGHAPPVVISPGALYAPLALNRWLREALPPARTAEPSSTPTATSTPIATPSPTSTRTPAAGRLRFDGFVRDGGESGPGVPDVQIAVSIRGTSMPPVTTESDGFYETPDYVVFAGDTWTVVPSKPGFTFAPPSASGVSRGFSIVERVDFVAFGGTAPPTATPTTAPTPRAALGFAGAPDGDRGETGRDVAAAQDESAVRFATVARVPLDDPRGVDAKAGLAVVADAALGLCVYDVRRPSAPVLLGRAATVGTADRVVVDGDVALVAHGEDSVSLYDLADPTSLRHLSTLKLGHPEWALTARDGMGLAADDRDLVLFEYSTPTAPREIGRLEMDFFRPAGIALSGDFAYVAHIWDRLRIVDIGDPAHPVARGRLGESGWASGQSVAVGGARAYLGERLQGAYFIPSPRSPTPGPSPTGPRPPTVVPAPAATEPPDGGRLTVVDVSDPDAPQAIGSSDALPGHPLTAVQADGDLVWAIAAPDPGWNDLVVLDVSDPAHPVPAKVEIEPALAWNADPRDIAIEGDTVYIATREALVVLRRVREWSGRPAYVPLAGKPAAPPLDAEDGDPALAYRGEWEPVADPDASGSAYKASGTAGARLTVRFTGRLLALHRPLAPGFAALAAICPEIASDIPCPAPPGEEAASDS